MVALDIDSVLRRPVCLVNLLGWAGRHRHAPDPGHHLLHVEAREPQIGQTWRGCGRIHLRRRRSCTLALIGARVHGRVMEGCRRRASASLLGEVPG